MSSWRIRLTGLCPAPRKPTPNSVRKDNLPSLEAAITEVIREWSPIIGRKIKRSELSGEQVPDRYEGHDQQHVVSATERSLPRGDR